MLAMVRHARAQGTGSRGIGAAAPADQGGARTARQTGDNLTPVAGKPLDGVDCMLHKTISCASTQRVDSHVR